MEDPAGHWLGEHVDDPDLAHLVRWARDAEATHRRAASLAALRQITAAFAAHRAYGMEGVRIAAQLEPGFDASLADLITTIGGLVHQRSPVEEHAE